MDEIQIYKILFWYEVLLNVLLWILYDPGRACFGVYLWTGIVLLLLLGGPAALDTLFIRARRT